MRLSYLGTPEIAVPPLHALRKAGHDIAIVVTAPERRRGRGGATSPTPVAQAAAAYGIPVTDDLERAAEVQAEIGVVVAYGAIIPEAMLRRIRMLNVHFSLLPRWRGAAPVERAILAGDAVTGVSIMEVAKGLDTGGIHAMEQTSIGPDEHVTPLQARLSALGGTLLGKVLAEPLTDAPAPQVGEVTYAHKLQRSDFELDWQRPTVELERIIRLDRAWTTFRGRTLHVRSARPAEGTGQPGSLLADGVATGDGALELIDIVPEGRSEVSFAEWRRGARPEEGERFG